MRRQVPIPPPDDEEVIGVLNAISIVSSRLARKLRAIAVQEPTPHKPILCPLWQERMSFYEAIRG